jgi:ubiquinone biosynthesis protein
LLDGRAVVVKVQRPGLERIVARDLAIVRWLARTAERRTAWGRAYGAVGLAEEFADALRTELDFVAEARNATELAAAVETQPVRSTSPRSSRS